MDLSWHEENTTVQACFFKISKATRGYKEPAGGCKRKLSLNSDTEVKKKSVVLKKHPIGIGVIF